MPLSVKSSSSRAWRLVPLMMGTLRTLNQIAEFLASPAVGVILSHKGLFPSLHPAVDNRLNFDHPWKWVGGGYIYQNDIGALIRHTNQVFEDAMNAF